MSANAGRSVSQTKDRSSLVILLLTLDFAVFFGLFVTSQMMSTQSQVVDVTALSTSFTAVDRHCDRKQSFTQIIVINSHSRFSNDTERRAVSRRQLRCLFSLIVSVVLLNCYADFTSITTITITAKC